MVTSSLANVSRTRTHHSHSDLSTLAVKLKKHLQQQLEQQPELSRISWVEASGAIHDQRRKDTRFGSNNGRGVYGVIARSVSLYRQQGTGNPQLPLLVRRELIEAGVLEE